MDKCWKFVSPLELHVVTETLSDGSDVVDVYVKGRTRLFAITPDDATVLIAKITAAIEEHTLNCTYVNGAYNATHDKTLTD